MGTTQRPPRLAELGALLRARRATSTPRGASDGDRRRVPGLRREELALEAGVSVSYYTRLEQGRAAGASDAVLAAICAALDMNDDDRAHAFSLLHPPPARTAGEETIRPQLLSLLSTLLPTPALVLGRARHVLAWNTTAHALLAPHLPLEAPSCGLWWPEVVFCDPHQRELYADWPAKARDTAADLRAGLASPSATPLLHSLVDDLRDRSVEFATTWNEFPVSVCAHHRRVYHHPSAGTLTIDDEFLDLADDNGQSLALFSAADETSRTGLTQLTEPNGLDAERQTHRRDP